MSVATEFALDLETCPETFGDGVGVAPAPGLRVAGRPVAEPRRRPVSPRPGPARPLSLRPAPVRVLHAPSTPSQLSPVRLTRRGVVVLAAAVALLGAVLVWLAAASAPAAAPAPVTGPATVAVQSGDTLWSIATRVAPERDPRAEVDVLQRLNHLDSVVLVPGQRLRLR